MEEQKEKNENLVSRPPIVAVMGHIDHGKTKLLDAIRKTDVVSKETGGITQHIGAYEIEVKSQNPEYQGRKITFLDTPGHEAFSKIRERGAKAADVAILVVAADEGVKPQTVEALKNIKESQIPYVVAINKIDKPESNVDKVKQQLAEKEVFLEGWGGNVPFVLISAKEGKNIEELLETILLVADMEELKTEKDAPASGIVVEAKMDNKRGVVVTLIIKQGVLRRGDEIATATSFGKIKILEDCHGKNISQACFSCPVLAGGFKSLPQVGEEFFAGKVDLKIFEEKAAKILEAARRNNLPGGSSREEEDNINLIVKADVAGSLEALMSILKNIQAPEKELNILSSSIGNISLSDVQLAKDSKAWILGFKVKLPKDLEIAAQEAKIKLFLFEIIYELEKFLKDSLEKIITQEQLARKSELRILKVFSSQGKKKLAGGVVEIGQIKKGKIKIIRDGQEAGIGKITSLQCQKKEINEAKEGVECGMLIETNAEIKEEDKIVVDN